MAAPLLKEIPQLIRAKIGLDRLEPRERMFVGIGVVFLACFFLLQFVVLPYLEAQQRLARSLTNKKADLEKILQLQKEHRLLRMAGGTDLRWSGQASGFSLFSFGSTREDQTADRLNEASDRGNGGSCPGIHRGDETAEGYPGAAGRFSEVD